MPKGSSLSIKVTNRPRCEMRPVFIIFVTLIRASHSIVSLWHIRYAGTVPIGAVFRNMPNLAFTCDFWGFGQSAGIRYNPRGEWSSNRKIEKNNP